jgi:hypothetical protein
MQYCTSSILCVCYSQRALNLSPEPAWELEEPEELPLPGLGTSFSTRSHSRRGSALLEDKQHRGLKTHTSPYPPREQFNSFQHHTELTTYLPAFRCTAWLLGGAEAWRGESLRDNTGDLDVVLTGTCGRQDGRPHTPGYRSINYHHHTAGPGTAA